MEESKLDIEKKIGIQAQRAHKCTSVCIYASTSILTMDGDRSCSHLMSANAKAGRYVEGKENFNSLGNFYLFPKVNMRVGKGLAYNEQVSILCFSEYD